MVRLGDISDYNTGGCNACLLSEFPLAGFEEACFYDCSACTESLGKHPVVTVQHEAILMQRVDNAKNLISLEPDPAPGESMRSLPTHGQHLDGRGLS